MLTSLRMQPGRTVPVLLFVVLVSAIISAGCFTITPGSFVKQTSEAGAAVTTAAGAPVSPVSPAPASPDPTGTPGTCDTGKTWCSGSCSDITLDIGNCGGCGLVCPANSSCSKSQCFCKDGYSATAAGACILSSSPATGVTTQTGQTTPKGNGCPPGEIPCDDGKCYCGSCGTLCLQSQTCKAGVCDPPVKTGSYCSDGKQHDLQTDVQNCGSCGNACTSPRSVCKLGICQCPTGKTLCGNTCADTSSDASNCGYCGKTCLSSQSCVSGNCQCPAGKSACGKSCVDMKTDPANCGSCGRFCPSGSTCSGGNCVCNAGLNLCGNNCVNLKVNRTNCGSCGHACTGQKDTCILGTCNCPVGKTYCGSACVDTSTDANNCGSCGNSCSTGYCSGGACTVNPNNVLPTRTFRPIQF